LEYFVYEILCLDAINHDPPCSYLVQRMKATFARIAERAQLTSLCPVLAVLVFARTAGKEIKCTYCVDGKKL
jgi:hypothetical protein